jgi:hypothetical protein
MQVRTVQLQEGDDVVFDGDVLAASDREMLQSVDSRLDNICHEGHAIDSCIIEIETTQPCSDRHDDLHKQRV